MGQWDDVMDLEDFIKKHGDKAINKAWRDHMSLHNTYEAAYDRLAELERALRTVTKFIQSRKP